MVTGGTGGPAKDRTRAATSDLHGRDAAGGGALCRCGNRNGRGEGEKGTLMAMKLEVVVVPVSDVEEAKLLSGPGSGRRDDADYSTGDGSRVIRLTRPGSECFISFGKGITSAASGSVASLTLVVDDIDMARAESDDRGVDVSEVPNDESGVWRQSGPVGRVAGPADQSPTRNRAMDVAALAELLHETAEHHDPFEKVAPKHDWWDWYAAYMTARQQGSSPEQASHAAATHMAEERHVVP